MYMNTLLPPAHSVLFGETEISFSLSYVDRKTLAIHVYPDGKIGVDAPFSTDIEKVYGKVKKRASWILKQQRQFESYPAPLPERRYVSGETHRYLGRQYRLKVIEGLGEAVKMTRGMLQVETHNPKDSLRVQRLLQAWYRSKALIVFTERYTQCVQRVERLGIYHDKGFQLRFMSKRWGSCTGKGNIYEEEKVQKTILQNGVLVLSMPGNLQRKCAIKSKQKNAYPQKSNPKNVRSLLAKEREID